MPTTDNGAVTRVTDAAATAPTVTLFTAHAIIGDMGPAAREAHEFRRRQMGRKMADRFLLARHAELHGLAVAS